jgi:flagellar hook-length control protein FliK
MIGNGAAPVQSAVSLLGASGGNTANASARGDASQEGVRFADFAASASASASANASASASAGTSAASGQDAAATATTAASTGGMTLPAVSTPLPLQTLTSLQQGAAAAAAANQAASLAANVAKLAAATAVSATAQAIDAANTATATAPTDALSMLAALSAQEPGDAAATAAPALSTPVAKPLDADSDTPTTPADATLSQQMLALLAGSLAITAPAQPTQGAVTLPTVDTSATGAGTSTASALMASNAASQLQQSPGLAQTGALSALLDPKAAVATDVPADALKLAMNVALDADSGSTFAVPTDKDDKTALFGLSGTGLTAPTLDRTLTSNAVTATPLTMPARPDDGFDDGLGTRIAWMAEQKLGHAQIRLNPENAGPIDVRIQLDGSQVNASFHSANADVRQALEASLPRLRDMLGQQGMQLGNTDIGQRQAQQQSSQGHPTPRGFTGNDDGSSAVTGISTQAAPIIVRSRGLLDEYA